ncbi:hypothetical protein PPMP20_24005 [Paraburkholderia phymatum]|uniref:Uncharacterized protein n=1 Tax=Paraburkholderia phymatum (strain DSM 17167 / CIP 108236 / LMG 21445 / STM815) TaxID=391038 RepID=B2JR04_PARP8|nr:hypothetical protein [Paraburkholderia phymatum]ACC73695.1 hypothetical protein Bphy_4584 [Paraburkholderia phymatum STM815]
MQVSRNRLDHQWSLGAVLLLMFASFSVRAESPCPAYVSLPTGSIFNLARLIADTGSPELALRKVKVSLAQIMAAGGCPKADEPNACQETVTVARKALAELEACTSPPLPEETAERNRREPSK